MRDTIFNIKLKEMCILIWVRFALPLFSPNTISITRLFLNSKIVINWMLISKWLITIDQFMNIIIETPQI